MIKDLGSEEAPALDNFTVGFFQHCWSSMKEIDYLHIP